MKQVKRRAFTYVELMFVAIILAVMMAIAIPNYTEVGVRADVSRTRASIATIANALENYRVDYRAYPPNKQTGVPSAEDLHVLTTPTAYLTSLPDFPFSHKQAARRVGALYLNLGQFHPKDAPFQPPMQGGYAMYSLTLPGPDGELRLEVGGGTATYEYYDPTNGTVSRGDHNLFGP